MRLARSPPEFLPGTRGSSRRSAGRAGSQRQVAGLGAPSGGSALVRAWPVRLLAAAGAALTLAGRPAAEPRPRPGSWLGCEAAFGPGAVGSVRYRAEAGRGSAGDLTVAVRLEPSAAARLPLATGSRLPVAITVGTAQPYLAGTVGLVWNGTALEGSLRLAAPFPAGFPALAAGAVVAVGGRPCTLRPRAPGR